MALLLRRTKFSSSSSSWDLSSRSASPSFRCRPGPERAGRSNPARAHTGQDEEHAVDLDVVAVAAAKKAITVGENAVQQAEEADDLLAHAEANERSRRTLSTRDKLMICDKIFRVVDPDDAKVDKRFISHVLGIHHVRAQIEREFSTKSGMMKNVSKPVLMSLAFPLPPKPDQFAMVKALGDARSRAVSLRDKGQQVRAQAWTDFEAALYAAEDAAGEAVEPVVAAS